MALVQEASTNAQPGGGGGGGVCAMMPVALTFGKLWKSRVRGRPSGGGGMSHLSALPLQASVCPERYCAAAARRTECPSCATIGTEGDDWFRASDSQPRCPFIRSPQALIVSLIVAIFSFLVCFQLCASLGSYLLR